MQDIGSVLNEIMLTENCSSVRAFFLLSENLEGRRTSNGLHKLQPKSNEKTRRRLRNKSDF